MTVNLNQGAIVATAIVSAEGQVTLPAEVCAALNLKPGSQVEFFETGKGQFTIVAAISPFQALEGFLRNRTARKVTIEEMNEAIAAEAVKGFKKSKRK